MFETRELTSCRSKLIHVLSLCAVSILFHAAPKIVKLVKLIWMLFSHWVLHSVIQERIQFYVDLLTLVSQPACTLVGTVLFWGLFCRSSVLCNVVFCNLTVFHWEISLKYVLFTKENKLSLITKFIYNYQIVFKQC